jgi:hypothetical protein
MSGLRVTDVQAALRHFANIGHDVTSDPRAVHVDGQPYRMSMGHNLYLHNDFKDNTSTYNSLNSYLMQSERPVITHLASSISSKNDNSSFDELFREATPLVPHTVETHESNGSTRQGFWMEDEIPDSTTGWHAETTTMPRGVTPLWTPHHYFDGMQHKDIHEALKAHTSPEAPYSGLYHAHNGEVSHFTSEQARDFDHKAVMDNVHKGLSISKNLFKGLVMVHHFKGGKSGMYHYDPQTEQLIDHKEGL